MNEYPKIQSVYKRYTDGPHKGKFIIGEWSDPVFEYLKDLIWVWKEKVDGTNIRVQYWGDTVQKHQKAVDCYGLSTVHVRGKTDKAQRIEPLYSIVEKMFPPEWFEEHFETAGLMDICLYGEGYGTGIQKGGKYRSDQSFVLFDIKIGPWWLKDSDIVQIASAGNIECVPRIFECSLREAIYDAKRGLPSKWSQRIENFNMEGLVGQPLIPLNMRNGQRIITKIKTKDFLPNKEK